MGESMRLLTLEKGELSMSWRNKNQLLWPVSDTPQRGGRCLGFFASCFFHLLLLDCFPGEESLFTVFVFPSVIWSETYVRRSSSQVPVHVLSLFLSFILVPRVTSREETGLHRLCCI